MYLKSLDINGFKSFADRTKLEFHPGVTGIVGPNGCGKSNVVDAIRWVLGETSAKALRGEDMVDVIFNGTESRKPLGMAEVQLTLADCEAALQVAFHEISIGRRVYRDGKSEYLFNRMPCRLRDLHDLFAGTGIGRSCYSIMQQGKIDLLLSSKPEDRRQVFEEAAGITKFKQQKREALRKLESTEANLLRIADVMEEQQRQLASLQRQASKARRYAALHEQLRVIELHWSHRQYSALSREREEHAGLLAATRERLRANQAAIALAQPALAESRAALHECESRIRDSLQRMAAVEARVATAQKQVDFNRERSSEWHDLIGRGKADSTALQERITAERGQLSAAGEELRRRSNDLRVREAELAAILETLSRHRATRQNIESELRRHQQQISSSEATAAACRAQLESFSAQLQAQEQRVLVLNRLRQEVEGSEREKAGESQRIESEVLRQRADLEVLLAELSRRQVDLAAWEEASQLAAGEVSERGRHLAGQQARWEMLRQLAAAGEGLESGTRRVLGGLDEPSRFREMVMGTLVSYLQVEDDYLAATEAALGHAVQAIVVESHAAAVAILERLREQKLGQAMLAVAEPGEGTCPPALEGSLGWLLSHLEIAGPGKPVLEHLLRGVALTPNLEAAMRLRRDHPATPVATLTGDFVSGQGIVTGGFRDPRTGSPLRIQREIRTLAKQNRELEQAFAALQEQATREAERVQTGRAEVTALLEQSRTSQLQVAQLEARAQVTARERDQLESRGKLLQDELAALEGVRDSLLARRDQAEVNLHRAVGERERLVSVVPDLESDWKQCLAQEEHSAEAAARLRTEVALARQSSESLHQQLGPLHARLQELEGSLQQRLSGIEAQSRRITAAEAESEGLRREIEGGQQESASLREAHEELLRRREVSAREIDEADAALAEQRERESQLTQQTAGCEVRVTQCELRLDNLAAQVSERYQVALPEFVPDPAALREAIELQRQARNLRGVPDRGPEPGSEASMLMEDVAPDWQLVEESLPEMRRKLDSLGAVNLDAIAEFDELEARFRLVSSQHEDLTKSREELLKIITRINRTTREQFADTFAQIAGHFRSMFTELFGRGAQADLVLLDEQDPLECGIDIIAKPPGKKLQSINLLSGGERSMTAVALLFAIYLVKPAPFCVLDELDAPLDDANIERFCRVLDRFCDQSQFIIVTHSKRTMHRADVMYGVSMEERGVSKTLSVKLERAESGAAS